MNNNTAKAKELLIQNNYTCVMVCQEAVYTATQRGVKPLLEWYGSGTDFRDFSVADKVVGKAAAFLYVLMKVQAVYAVIISKHALAVLEEYGIAVDYDTVVDAIRNRTDTGSCPMELAVKNITEPNEALAAIQSTLQALSRNAFFDQLKKETLCSGAHRAAIIKTEDIVLDRSFRDLCAVNTCGMYGRCWMCPPHIGEIEDLMNQLKTYDYALVYQTVSNLEDSYDFEGMLAAKESMQKFSRSLRPLIEKAGFKKVLHLGAGGCRLCETCAVKTNQPCRHPDLAISSLEAFGVNVSLLAEVAGMKYINGPNTVTYFGTILFTL